MSPRSPDTTTQSHSSDAVEPVRAQLIPTLTVVHHPDDARLMARAAVPLRRTTLGRGSALCGSGAFDDPLVSRNHVHLQWTDDGMTLTDAGSHNGTFLNGARVASATARLGDLIEIGPVMLLLHLTEAAFSVPKAEHWVGKGAASARLLDGIEMAARHDGPVMLIGETGSGKEVVARELHRRRRCSGAFVAVNTAAIPPQLIASELFGHERGAFSGAVASHPGLFEQARDGTLMLDEIGDASPELQASLLRVLQEREVRRLGGAKPIRVNARVVAATHKDLSLAMVEGRFREDLFGRLAGWQLVVPPLRERLEDVPLLARRILRLVGEERPLHPNLVRALLRFRYPRNVRQLQAILHRVVHSTPSGTPSLRLTPDVEEMLGPASSVVASAPQSAPRELRDDPEGLARFMRTHGWNVTHAARELEIGRNTLYAWLRRVGLPGGRGDDEPHGA